MYVEEEHPSCGGGQSSSCASQSRALTIEAEVMSSKKQRKIDLLEAQLQEAEEIIINLRWVRDKLEEAMVNVVNKEKEETILAHPEASVASLHPPNQEVSVSISDSLPNQRLLRDGDDEKQFDGLSIETSNGFDACESELDADIRNKKLELSRNGCTQMIHALKRKSSPCANEEERLSPLPKRDNAGRRSFLPKAPPRTPAEMMTSFVVPGSVMPPFSHLSDLNRERYFRFAEKIGEVMIEFNNTVVSYEEQLGIASSSNEVSALNRKISDLEEENARTVERANKIRSRMLQAEADFAEADTARIDLTEKLKVATNVSVESQEELARMRAKVEELELRNQLLQSENRAETEKAKSEERKKLQADYREKMGELKTFLEEFERIVLTTTRAAETKAYRGLLEDIRDGKIIDIEAELEEVKADEEEATKKAAEVSALKPDLPKFDLLFVDSPEVEEDVSAQQPELIINESVTLWVNRSSQRSGLL